MTIIETLTCSVSGRVFDTVTGEGIAGAEVRFGGGEEIYRTDETGAFFIPSIRLGQKSSLWWTAPGHCRPSTRHALIPTPGGEITGIELPLIPMPALTIRVESTGGPLAGAEVMLGARVPMELPNPDSGARYATYGRSEFVKRTAEDGTAVYDRVALEYIEGLFVVVRCEGYETREKAIRWDGKSATELRILLPRAPERALEIRCPDATLTGGTVVFVDRTPQWALWDTGDLIPTPYRADLRSYPIGEDGSVRFHSDQWPNAAVISAPEIGVRMVKLGDLSGSRKRTCTISPGPRWEGQFVDGQGIPIDGIRVSISDRGGGSRGPFSPRAAVGPLFRSTTDGEGRISFPRLEEASHWTECQLAVHHTQWEPADRRELYLAVAPRTIVMKRVEAIDRVRVSLRLGGGASRPGTAHLQGMRWSRFGSKDHGALRARREEFLASPPERRPSLELIESWAKRHLEHGELRATGSVLHVASDGEWPVRSIRDHLGPHSLNDVLCEMGGARALLWAVEIPDSQVGGSEASRSGIEIRFLPRE